MPQVSGADELADRELADDTLGSAANPETSYVGLVLAVMNINLNPSIPVSSGYAGRVINIVDTSGSGTGQLELSVFRCLEPSIIAIDAMIKMGPKLIIGAQQIDKSAVAIDAIINQDAWYCIYVRVGQKASTIAQVSGADESVHQIYALDSCMSGELAFADNTLGSTADPETSYVSLVLFSSWWNNLNLPILAGNRNLGQTINPSGAAN
jgi:hypothetical protein